ncbi:hypothetical protein CEXT_604381 [Caerostris extrusa]|uniref:Uncharacterized protein n=1 Tax=Caerostris extrusa TaxID=172846 RepID=A0AAV4RHD5_CAEEX|nr:hypothetical protein CEXT_604381 [Caerostris extrusa]
MQLRNSCAHYPCLSRPEGGIKPLRFSSATVSKAAHQTTGAHLGTIIRLLPGICTGYKIAKHKVITTQFHILQMTDRGKSKSLESADEGTLLHFFKYSRTQLSS